MPSRPPRPCGQPGCGVLVQPPARRCGAHQRGPGSDHERRRQADLTKGEGRQFYSGKEWRRLRAIVLQRDKFCVCGYPLKVNDPQSVADHILTRRDRPDLAYDLNNLKGSCKPCHDRRTVKEHGGLGHRMPTAPPKPCSVPGCHRLAPRPYHQCAYHREERRGLMLPTVQPSAIPLTIVCGPPGSGKNYYVTQHAQPDDLVIDLDQIKSRLSGMPLYHAPETWFERAIVERNRLLANLSTQTTGRAWFVLTAPRAEDRQHWHDNLKPESIVVLTTPAEICLQHMRSDSRRRGMADQFERIVRSWWREYEPRDGDTLCYVSH